MEERRLVELAREGRADAYGELVRTYQSRVFNMAYGFTGNRESADDLAQEVFLKAYLALPRFRFGSAFGTWLYRIAVNHIKDFLRKRGKVREVSLEAVGEPAAAGDAFAALENEREDERKRRLVRRELADAPGQIQGRPDPAGYRRASVRRDRPDPQALSRDPGLPPPQGAEDAPEEGGPGLGKTGTGKPGPGPRPGRRDP